VVKRMRGYTLMELSVLIAVFGVFLMIFFQLTAEMRGWEKRLPVSFLKHPQVASVVSRLRRDVLDAYIPFEHTSPYRNTLGTFEMGPQVLILDTLQTDGTKETAVWDFREKGVVHRHAYISDQKRDTWTARGLPPTFAVDFDAVRISTRNPYAVRILAVDEKGRLAIDQILQPRAHK
jgi:hypothetical protein